jgi:hypothetical protein
LWSESEILHFLSPRSLVTHSGHPLPSRTANPREFTRMNSEVVMEYSFTPSPNRVHWRPFAVDSAFRIPHSALVRALGVLLVNFHAPFSVLSVSSCSPSPTFIHHETHEMDERDLRLHFTALKPTAPGPILGLHEASASALTCIRLWRRLPSYGLCRNTHVHSARSPTDGRRAVRGVTDISGEAARSGRLDSRLEL